MSRTAVVVPCYNEENRLNSQAFIEFVGHNPWAHIVFVNDGSKDDTLALLKQMHDQAPRSISIVDLGQNSGKAEAVRQGMLTAAQNPDFALIAFWDADLATPLSEVPRFVEEFDANPDALVVMGSRLRLLGHDVRRKPYRALLGRVFATVAGLVIDMPVHDTQCGAKMFRNAPVLRNLFGSPFLSRWIFDVEVLVRLGQYIGDPRAADISAVHELPLRRWEDVGGSKLKPRDFLKAFGELARIKMRYRDTTPTLGDAVPTVIREFTTSLPRAI